MEANVLSLNGEVIEKIKLPKVFKERIREDLIRRAFLATQSKKRQPYGTDVMAGKRTSAHYHGMRRSRYSMMNREMARLPRLHETSMHLHWRARRVPQARGGRAPHPPKVEKEFELKINKKERRTAIKSAIAATSIKDFVLRRGHRVEDIDILPIVVDDKIQEIKKTKELVKILEKIGLKKELERIKKKKIRPGKGKLRGRRIKRKVGPLFVVTEDKGIGKAVKNLPGCHVCRVENLSVEHLAPGAMPGRLVIFTKSSIEKLRKV